MFGFDKMFDLNCDGHLDSFDENEEEDIFVDAEVTLECKNELAGVVIDRFGYDVWLIPQGEDHFKTRVLVSVSPQFFGWVTGIGSGIKIKGPDNVKAEYKAYLQNMLENY